MTILETEKLAQRSKVILLIDLVLIVITKEHCKVTTLKVNLMSLAFFQEILN